jgi:hypothetical protein
MFRSLRTEPVRVGLRRAAVLCAAALATAGGCNFDRADRWLYRPSEPSCTPGATRCQPELERCDDAPEGPAWVRVENCSKQGLVCSESLAACATCLPDTLGCEDGRTAVCRSDGSGFDLGERCDGDAGLACRLGVCTNLCLEAAQKRSNVGCEYWAADLDNANVSDTLNAAAQQFAVVVSNAQPDLTAEVRVYADDSAPGEENDDYEVARASIPPRSLRVFQLGPREVDGSAPGTFNTGTHTALTRAAYQVRSSVPVVAYQFNPLSNVGVFSNDASLLKPREAVDPEVGELLDAYVVLGWPQTIATSDDPRYNFNANDPIDLRAFMTVIGTRPNTTVRVKPTARILGAPGIPETLPGEELEVTIGPYDVLNLETDEFNADFTGSVIQADNAVIAFTGSEASDAPYLEDLSGRRCCADHLEEQLDHVRTAGRVFVAPVTPNRSEALLAAGANLGLAEQDDFFRVLATTSAGANVTTSLGKNGSFRLEGQGDFVDLVTDQSFTIESDAPISLMSISPSQEAAGVPNSLPGGDPSSLVIPPIEQYRTTYVFLTPDKYAFDFVRISAPEGATIVFDGQSLDALQCQSERAGVAARPLAQPEVWLVHTCQLGFPLIDPTLTPPLDLSIGDQSDGVHVIESNRKIGVLVDGFDRFVSYAYAAGTELEFIVPR